MPGQDLDHDGDYDSYDQQLQIYQDNPELALGELSEVRSDLFWQNLVHEFAEDVAELLDDNPDNDSFTDGGNGSGNEPPTEQSPLPPGQDPGAPWAFPVTVTLGGFNYDYFNGVFTLIGAGPGGGGGGGDIV